MAIEKELNCEGFYGFGGGYDLAKRGPTPAGSYCNDCPLNAACWTKHKERCSQLFPSIVAAFEEMAKTMKGPELVKAWMQKAGCGDPYTMVMAGNFEDGNRVGGGFPPADRKKGTLPYPFIKH